MYNSIRKVKKEIKKSPCKQFIKSSLKELKMIRTWMHIDSEYSKRNMKIVTGNFSWRGQFHPIDKISGSGKCFKKCIKHIETLDELSCKC